MNKSKISRISRMLVLFSFLQFYVIMFLMSLPLRIYATSSEGFYYIVNRSWISYFFLPFSIFSVFFGIKYKNTGYKVRKNVIVGITTGILVFSIGISGLLSMRYYSTDYEYVRIVEEKISFDIPDEGRVVTKYAYRGNQAVDEYDYLSAESVVRFTNETENHLFSLSVIHSGEWLDDYGMPMVALLPARLYMETENYDYYMLFSVENNEHNLISKTGSEHHFLYLVYDVSERVMLIYEFIKVY